MQIHVLDLRVIGVRVYHVRGTITTESAKICKIRASIYSKILLISVDWLTGLLAYFIDVGHYLIWVY